LGGAQQRALLALLLIHRGEVVSTDRLIDELWGERAPPTAAKTVQGYISQLRKVLGGDAIGTRGHGYVLEVDSDQVDACRFEALVADGRSALADGDGATARQRLGEALGLWRGEPLADFAYESFARGEIARLGQARLAAVEDRVEAQLALGEHASLVGELEALVSRYPLRERLQSQLMLALYRSGRQAEALESYRKARAALNDELGLEPGRELQELERAILAHDPTLEPAPRPAASRRAAARGRVRRGAMLIAAGGAVLLVAVAAVAVKLTGGSTTRLANVQPNSVAAISTRTNRVLGQVPVGARPAEIAFGSGSLWVANLDDQTISRVDPEALRTVRTLSVRDPPTGIAATSGNVWVVGSNADATAVTVRHIDPQFDFIDHTLRIGTIVPGDPGSVTARGSAVWIAPSSGVLTRLDPVTGRAVQHVDPNTAPTAVALGAGAVWATDSDADNVTRVDPAGLVSAIAVGHGPSGIAVGAGGVWVADSLDDAIVRIDPSTRAPTAMIPVGRSPTGVAVGAGSVWVANSGDGTVTRIDPGTDKVVATSVVGGSPRAITVVDGRAWVTVDARRIAATGVTGGGTLRLDSQSDVDSMDPALAYTGLSQQLLYATCAKLLSYPDKGGPAGSQLTPEVAQSLPTRSVDGRTYTFTIRKGFRFSPPSNEPVTAQTFKKTIERSLNPRMKSPLAHEFGAEILGAGAYMAGKSPHIPGLRAAGDTLTIRLRTPAPDFPTRVAQPIFCAVPSGTPVDPRGVRAVPSAGPYYVASYTPGQGVVLVRNPNYRGSRPHRFERIELSVGISTVRAVAEVASGTTDFTSIGGGPGNVASEASALAARYGPGSAAAASGRQQYFVNPAPQLDYFALNTHRPLFSDVRMRQAVNYAIDRRALARLGDGFQPLPERTADHYLPPGMPGFSDLHIYPSSPNPIRARHLADGKGRTAVLDICDVPPCDEQAQIVKTDLAAIGLRVEVKKIPFGNLFARLATPGESFDLAYIGWIPDYPDPTAMLNPLLADSSVSPSFDDPTYRRRLAATARLSGPDRYLTYAKLDADLARNAAPLIAYGNQSSHDFFSARIGCQSYGIYGIDLAALCLRRRVS
jgi:YVTN family beta-propeller protein